MTYVALALAAALLVTIALLGGIVRSQQRAHARREDLLLNQILHLSGRPWQPAPADTWTMPAPADGEQEWPVWAGAAEQAEVY